MEIQGLQNIYSSFTLPEFSVLMENMEFSTWMLKCCWQWFLGKYELENSKLISVFKWCWQCASSRRQTQNVEALGHSHASYSTFSPSNRIDLQHNNSDNYQQTTFTYVGQNFFHRSIQHFPHRIIQHGFVLTSQLGMGINQENSNSWVFMVYGVR